MSSSQSAPSAAQHSVPASSLLPAPGGERPAVSPVPYQAIPFGWYAVARSRELPPAAVRTLRLFDRELVLFRTAGGEAALVDAYCPHLGAHLGGGTVRGECLRCPFHGFEFQTDGRCARTPYPSHRPPPRALLPTLPVRERFGMVLAWYAADGRAPGWEPPAIDPAGWTDFRVTDFHFRGHPQEVSENSVDLGHFGVVHGYSDARAVERPVIEGHLLRARYAVERSLAFVGLPLRARMEFSAEVHGLGISLVRAEVRRLGVDLRLLVLPTPVDASHVHLRIASSVKRTPLLPFTWLVQAVLHNGYRSDVAADVPVWQTKRYLPRPALADGDGPIGLYRRYAAQFYG